MGQQPPSLPGKSCTKILGDILLISLGLLLVLSLVEFADKPFHAANTLHELRLSLSNEDIDESFRLIKRLHGMGDGKLDAFKALLDQELYLLTRIKDRYIEDDREEVEVAEIANFQKKMEHQRQVFKDSRDGFKGLTDEATTLSALHKHSLQDLQKGKELKGKTQSLANRFNQFIREMDGAIKLNSKWSQSVQNKMNSLEPQAEEHKSEKSQFTDVTQVPEYNSMPVLAQEILKPNQMDFLKQLYSDQGKLHEESELQKREKFYKEREYLADHHPEFEQAGSISLTRYNLQSGVERRSWKEDILGDYPRLNKKFKLDDVSSEMGFCVIVPTYNNGNSFRTELNLNSIFSQNYTNYKVVVIDDASTDNTPAIVKKYLNFYDIPEKKCELIVNKENKKALENIYMAIMNRCDGYEVAAIVDGDDELIGFNVLKVLNAVYAGQKLGVLYSNFYFYRHSLFDIKAGFNSQYLDQQKKHPRETYQRFSHLISFKVELLKEVKVADLQYTNGRFYHVAYDYAMMYPIMELSCGHIKYIDEYQYLYSTGTGLNDYEVLGQDQKNLGEAILKKTPYECSPKYKD